MATMESEWMFKCLSTQGTVLTKIDTWGENDDGDDGDDEHDEHDDEDDDDDNY